MDEPVFGGRAPYISPSFGWAGNGTPTARGGGPLSSPRGRAWHSRGRGGFGRGLVTGLSSVGSVRFRRLASMSALGLAGRLYGRAARTLAVLIQAVVGRV